MKRLPWFEIILIVVVMSISVYAALSDAQNFSLRWFTRDDAYYYFKVAQNISEGHGSTFDGINKTNGYHPLWMVICIPIFALARLDLILPLRILFLVLSGLSVWTAILLYRLAGKIISPAIGAIAALYWVFNFDIVVNIYQQGLESGIAAFFVVLCLYKMYEFEIAWRKNEVTRNQILMLGVIGTLTVFSRLDLVFFVGMAGAWIVLRGDPLRYFLPLDSIIAIGSILLAYIIRLDLPGYYHYSDIAIITAGLGLVIKLTSAYVLGLYQRETLGRLGLFLVRLAAATLTSSFLLGGIMLVIAQTGSYAGFPRMVLLWDLLFTFAGFGLTRLAYFHLHGTSENVRSGSRIAAFGAQWKVWLRDSIRYFGVVLGSLAVYMIWSKIAFGTFSPVSGQIKRWWGSFPARVYGGATRDLFDFFGFAYSGDGLGWAPITSTLGTWIKQTSRISAVIETRYAIALAALLVVACLILSLHPSLVRRSVTQLGMVPLVSSAILQAMYYHAAGYSAFKGWYWVSQRIAAILVLCLIAGVLFSLTRKIPFRQYSAWAVVAYLGFTMSQTYWAGMQNTMRYNRWPPGTPNMEIATLLEQHTEPGSLIGFTGGGNVGYFIEGRTIVNMDGLINSKAYFDALQTGRAGEFLNEMGLDYVLANPALLDQLPYAGQFNDFFEPTEIFYGGKQLLKFRAPGDASAPILAGD